MRVLDKLKDTWHFLRYGPTQARRIDEHLRGLGERLRALGEEADHRQASVDARLSAYEQRLAHAEQRIVSELAEVTVQLRRTNDEVLRDFDSLRSQLSGLRAGLDRVAASPAGAGQPASANAAEAAFYPVLERHFRGSEALVKERLAVYRAHVERMPVGRVADIGCGRGEWVELLREWGRDAVGIDANPLVAQELSAKGLPCEQGDAISWLQIQPDASLAGVTAFHLVEHLPFGVLLRMLQEAERALMPGGVLILETPNPENADVATRTFWLDPSHVRPLPPELLVLAVQSSGFREEELLRLQRGAEDLPASRDYAVAARKARR